MSTETFTYLGMLYSPIRERLPTHKVPEFSYSLTGVFFVFLFFFVFFVYNFLQLYKDIRVVQGNLQPMNKKKWWHDISAQVRFISTSFEIV